MKKAKLRELRYSQVVEDKNAETIKVKAVKVEDGKVVPKETKKKEEK